ncbi:MAG TPA: DUF2231 domain-containing protein [Clostridia bacterium]|nr:DUF2231 domain-containing protein [Clostridia bacterium]
MRSRAHLGSHPLHPILVTFPIGLWVASLIFDLIATSTNNNLLWAAGFYAVIGGCIGAVAAAIAGVTDLLSVVPPNSSAKQRGFIHGGLNSLGLLLFIYVAWRRGGPYDAPDRVALIVSFLGVALILFSGWLGGTLVYRNQIGVDRRYANAGKWKERELKAWDRPACNQSELGEGQLMLVRVDNERVAIGKCGDGVFAFSDHCTHRGGPLSDGALIGCTVQCPWHGSQFDLRTGRVVAGPAEQQIKLYNTDIRGGEVYVRPRHPQDERKVA